MGRMLAPLLASAALIAGCQTVPRPVSTAATTPAALSASARCADVFFPVYFASGSTALTQPALLAIHTAAVQSKGCQTALINVTGLADFSGAPERNAALSRERAETVAAALAAQGFPRPSFEIESAGSAGARTDGGVAEPARRRAEVLIQFKR